MRISNNVKISVAINSCSGHIQVSSELDVHSFCKLGRNQMFKFTVYEMLIYMSTVDIIKLKIDSMKDYGRWVKYWTLRAIGKQGPP